MWLVSVQLGYVENATTCHGANLDTWTPTTFSDHSKQTAICTEGWILLAAIRTEPLDRTLPAATGNQTQADACR